jgi:circadian clock protein KaiC
MDMLKGSGTSALFTSLTTEREESPKDATEEAVSSLADTWIKLKNERKDGGMIRNLLVVKSRGMGHYNGISEFTINDKGIEFLNSSSEWHNMQEISNRQRQRKKRKVSRKS